MNYKFWKDEEIKKRCDDLAVSTNRGQGTKWFVVKSLLTIYFGLGILLYPYAVAAQVSSSWEIAIWIVFAGASIVGIWSTRSDEKRNKEFKEIDLERRNRGL